MKRFIWLTLVVYFLIHNILSLFAYDEVLVLGKDQNWDGLIKTDGLTTRQGRGGNLDLILRDSEYDQTETTDLLLHFNELPLEDASHHYRLKEAASVQANHEYAKFGENCAVFQGNNGLTLFPVTGSLFSPNTTWGDFTVEFWLYPASLGEGESVLVWTGFRIFNKTVIAQKIECRIENRALVWSFDNVFGSATGEPFQFEMKSVEKLIPRQWRHHMLRFDSTTGFLEYAIDGVPAGTRYATLSGKEGSSFFIPSIGTAENTSLELGKRFTGFMDELRISREYVKKPVLAKYDSAHGRAVSKVFDLGFSGTTVKRIDALLEKAGNSEVTFYVRCSDTFTTVDRLKEEWIPFLPGTLFNDRLKGRYLQIAIDFFPDGRKENTPRLFQIDVVYEPDFPPASPLGLKATPGNGKVTLSWKPVNEDDVKGYYVFYGESPLSYMGEDAKQGKSPINVGNATSIELTGLKNGKLYYFSIAAYDSSLPPHMSEFQEEKSARPAEVLP